MRRRTRSRSTARSAVSPVPRALERSTDSAPSTTQNACCTSSAGRQPDRDRQPGRTADRRAQDRRAPVQLLAGQLAGGGAPAAQRLRGQAGPRTCSTCSATVWAPKPSALAANDGSCALVTGNSPSARPIRSSVAFAARLPGRPQRPQPGPDRLLGVRGDQPGRAPVQQRAGHLDDRVDLAAAGVPALVGGGHPGRHAGEPVQLVDEHGQRPVGVPGAARPVGSTARTPTAAAGGRVGRLGGQPVDRVGPGLGDQQRAQRPAGLGRPGAQRARRRRRRAAASRPVRRRPPRAPSRPAATAAPTTAPGSTPAARTSAAPRSSPRPRTSRGRRPSARRSRPPPSRSPR